MALAQFAPSLIKIFGGSDKTADIAGKVIDIAKTVTGADTGEAALEVLKVDPVKALEFKQAALDRQAELTKAFLVDVQDARHMQIAALGQADIFSKRFVYYFAIGWSLFAMAYFTAITFIKLHPEGQRVADTIMGVLIGTVLVGIFHYLYGSTSTSQMKDTTISNLAKP